MKQQHAKILNQKF